MCFRCLQTPKKKRTTWSGLAPRRCSPGGLVVGETRRRQRQGGPAASPVRPVGQNLAPVGPRGRRRTDAPYTHTNTVMRSRSTPTPIGIDHGSIDRSIADTRSSPQVGDEQRRFLLSCFVHDKFCKQ